MLDFAKLSRLILDDLNKSRKTQIFFNKYKKEDVVSYLSKPQQCSKQLREMSNFLYIVSSHYRRLVNYFAKLYLLDYIIEPYYLDINKLNKRTFEVTYNTICDNVENMNLMKRGYL
jgi:hypothetical protein